jgi:hypothetical protein
VSHEFDYNSPLSEKAQDALINAYLHVGGRVGLASDDALTELVEAGLITHKYNLTASGVTEGIRLWEHYWQMQFDRTNYRRL